MTAKLKQTREMEQREEPASSSSSPVTMTFGYSLMVSWRLTLAAPMVRISGLLEFGETETEDGKGKK